MKDLDKYSVKKIEDIKNINGGCFAYDLGALIRYAWNTAGGTNPAGGTGTIVDYVEHYSGENVH